MLILKLTSTLVESGRYQCGERVGDAVPETFLESLPLNPEKQFDLGDQLVRHVVRQPSRT